MCGILGYVGTKENAGELAFLGLKKLEYRGYDSWGLAEVGGNRIKIIKKVGKIGSFLPKFSKSNLALGQTRWATHGGVTIRNAHPHLDCSKKIAIVHNGVIENYQELKRDLLKRGHKILSETDTEIIAHLIEEESRHSNQFARAVCRSFLKLAGLNALVALNASSGELVCAKNGAPLVIGVSNEGMFVASDALGVLDYTKRLYFLSDYDVVSLTKNKVSVFEARSWKEKKINIRKVNWDISEESLNGHKHFLEKEIFEQPRVLRDISEYKNEKIAGLANLIAKSFGTYLVGCGTASYACLAGTYLFGLIAKRHLNFSIGSEFNYLEEFITKKSLIIGVSQSGETADIIESISRAKMKGAKIASIVNVFGSTLFRMSDYTLLIGAGQERAVISTKAFSGQVSLLLLVAYYLAGNVNFGREVLRKTILSLKEVLSLKTIGVIRTLTKKLSRMAHIYIIGRGLSYPVALEGALKIKEGSYIHSEGFAAGELKHGVIALISKGTPCIVVAPKDETYGATMAAAMEVKARGGYIIGISSGPNEIFDFFVSVPDCGFGSVISNVAVFQLLAYYLTLARGNDPDKPRNLAKSVTVK